MELYDLLNIRNIDIESTIEDAINETIEQLNGLTDERTCLIYTSYLYDNLKKRHIVARIIDTKDDLNMSYKHQFVLVPKDSDNNYILDLTAKQFGSNDLYDQLNSKGYQLLSSNLYQSYLNHIESSTIKSGRMI